MSEIFLSVVVPVYNEEKYIKKCVESILRQDYLTLEIILVDDGSSDQSGIICDFLAEKNSCIRALHIKNGGIAMARFKGVEGAKGRWVTFVDADDWIDKDAYKDIDFDEKNDVVITGICRYIDEERQIMQMPYLKEGIYGKEAIMNKIVPIMLWHAKLNAWALDPSLCTKIFKKNILLDQLKKVSDVGSDYGEDSMVIYPMMFQVEQIQILKKIYYFHRQRASGELPYYITDEEFISKLQKVYEYLKREFKKTEYWNDMKMQLDCFFITSLEIKKRCFEYPIFKFSAYFPMERVPLGSKVVLYGAGNIGKQYWQQNSVYHFCNIVSWVDAKYEERQNNNYVVQNPDEIREMDFDFVVIAVDNYYVAEEIALYLCNLGVASEKVVWHSTRVDCRELNGTFDISKEETL